jgi:hypothetical protein
MQQYDPYLRHAGRPGQGQGGRPSSYADDRVVPVNEEPEKKGVWKCIPLSSRTISVLNWLAVVVHLTMFCAAVYGR